MKKQHGLKKYKCNFCNFRSENLSNVNRHEKTKHENEVFKCDQCEYTTARKDKLRRHTRSKHLEKNVKCEHCNFVTDRNENLKRHHNLIHTQKYCEECDFTTFSQMDLKKHKTTQHEPDHFEEKSAFNRVLYQKTWKVRGLKDPLSTLNVYKEKIRNTINNYLQTKGPTKWYIGMEIIMHKIDKEGKITNEIDPGFSSNMKTTLHMWNFDELYNECSEKIMKNFVEFNANGSGWILSRVRLISVHMHLIPGINMDDIENSNESEVDDDI